MQGQRKEGLKVFKWRKLGVNEVNKGSEIQGEATMSKQGQKWFRANEIWNSGISQVNRSRIKMKFYKVRIFLTLNKLVNLSSVVVVVTMVYIKSHVGFRIVYLFVAGISQWCGTIRVSRIISQGANARPLFDASAFEVCASSRCTFGVVLQVELGSHLLSFIMKCRDRRSPYCYA